LQFPWFDLVGCVKIPRIGKSLALTDCKVPIVKQAKRHKGSITSRILVSGMQAMTEWKLLWQQKLRTENWKLVSILTAVASKSMR